MSSVAPSNAWIGPVAVVAVAILAAWFAQRRLTQQLGAEERRLGLQLSHDRQLQDIAELRTLLDVIAGHVTVIKDDLGNALMLVEFMVPNPNAAQQKSGMDITVKAWSAKDPLKADADRLAIRLGNAHPMVMAVEELDLALLQALKPLGHGTGPFTPPVRAEVLSAGDRVFSAADEVLSAAHRAAGSRLNDDKPAVEEDDSAPAPLGPVVRLRRP